MNMSIRSTGTEPNTLFVSKTINSRTSLHVVIFVFTYSRSFCLLVIFLCNTKVKWCGNGVASANTGSLQVSREVY